MTWQVDGNTDGDYDDTADHTDHVLYYTNDANMNVTALVNTSGQVVERYVYDAYGRVTVLNGEADRDGGVSDWSADADNTSDWDNEILYCGYRYDPTVALYHVRHRVYDPELGRWLQRDPLGYVDGMGLYEYVQCKPLRFIDPSGLNAKEEVINKGFDDFLDSMEKLKDVDGIVKAVGKAAKCADLVDNTVGSTIKGMPQELASALRSFSASVHCMSWYRGAVRSLIAADHCVKMWQKRSARAKCNNITTMSPFEVCAGHISDEGNNFPAWMLSQGFKAMGNALKKRCLDRVGN